MIRIFAPFLVLLIAVFPVHAAQKIEQVVSPGGIKAWLVTEPSIPMISIEIGFRGGPALDAPEKAGATYLMTGLLEEGTGDMDSAGFSRSVETLAANFGFDASRESISISATVLKENAPAALDLLKQALINPAFNQVAIDRVKGQIQSIISSDETDPDSIASRTIAKLAYSGHPYGRTKEGTKDTLAGLTREDIIAAHSYAMTLDQVYVGVVGDVTPEELGPMLDSLLGELPAKGAPQPSEIEFGASGGVTIVPLSVPQSNAIWMHKGIDLWDEDFFAAYVMNRVLGGGGFTSRLTEEVREKRGLTYGVYSFLGTRDKSNFIGGSVASSNDRISQAIDIIRAEWTRMANDGATDEEIDAAKKYLTGAYPLRWDGNSNIAKIIKGMQMDGFDIDYPLTRNDRVNEVTKADVARVAKRLLKTEDIRFVIVGQPEGIEATD